MTPYVSIITITRNHFKYIMEILNSLFTTGRPSVPLEVIIVDNCSSDGTIYFLKKNRFNNPTNKLNNVIIGEKYNLSSTNRT